jgi:hypothetical protein
MKLNLLPARTGMQWLREGVRTVWRAPLALGGLVLMFITAIGMLPLIPLIGAPLALALAPAGTVGLMAAARQTAEGGLPLPALLLTALRQSPRQTRAVLALGTLYGGAVLCILTLILWLDDGQMAQLVVKYGNRISPELLADPQTRPAARAFMRHLLIGGLCYIPVSALLWHAPALVHWHGMPVGKSLFASAIAILRNAPAYLMYCIGWMAVASIGWAGLLVATGMTGNLAVFIGGLPLLNVLIAAMFHTSLWFTFRDSFTADTPPADAPPPLPDAQD